VLHLAEASASIKYGRIVVAQTLLSVLLMLGIGEEIGLRLTTSDRTAG
jgi:hypothetical protein